MKTQQRIELSRQAGSSPTATTRHPDWREGKRKLDSGALLSTVDVAALFGVSVTTVVSWAKRGKLVGEPVNRVNSKPGWIFQPNDVRTALGWGKPNS